MESPSDILKLDNIHVEYGNIRALPGLSLSVHKGEIHGIVGEHGAGKSSIVKVISGFVRPRSGTVTVDGKESPYLTCRQAHKLGIETVYQEVEMYDNLSVLDYLRLIEDDNQRFLLSKSEGGKIRDIIASFDLHLDVSKSLKELTSETKAELALIRCLMRNPRLLVLDEVFEKLPAPVINYFEDLIQRRVSEGMAVLIVTHRIDSVFRLAERISIVRNGEIILNDKVGNIDKFNLIRLTYTQYSAAKPKVAADRDFYDLLKFNRAILETLPINLVIVDAERTIQVINPSARSFFSISSREYIDAPIEDLFSREDTQLLDVLNHALTAERIEPFYSLPLTRAGKRTHVNLIVCPVIDGTATIGHLVLIEDVTEYEKLRSRLDLNERLASLGLLSAGLAHELNNPVGVVNNNLRLLLKRVSDEDVRNRAEVIDEQMKYISTIINNLVMFSEGKDAPRIRFNPHPLIVDLLQLVKVSAREKRIEIVYEPADTGVEITMNETSFKQVLLNLLRNAFEAIGEDGTVTIGTRSDTEPEGLFHLSVSDTGHGIPSDRVNSIFNPFYTTRGGSSQNMGLGLSIIYQIVSTAGGTVKVHSTEEGTTFDISLPGLSASQFE